MGEEGFNGSHPPSWFTKGAFGFKDQAQGDFRGQAGQGALASGDARERGGSSTRPSPSP